MIGATVAVPLHGQETGCARARFGRVLVSVDVLLSQVGRRSIENCGKECLELLSLLLTVFLVAVQQLPKTGARFKTYMDARNKVGCAYSNVISPLLSLSNAFMIRSIWKSSSGNFDSCK